MLRRRQSNTSSTKNKNQRQVTKSKSLPSIHIMQSLISARILITYKSPEKNVPKLNILKLQNKKQNLNQTNYNIFLEKAKQQNGHNIPSSFKLIELSKKQHMKSYDSLNFNILSYTNNELVEISAEIIGKFGLAEIGGKFMLVRVIREIFYGYNYVSYHNFSHAFSLMHMFYHLVKMDQKFKDLYTREEIGFTLIAALAHDINHKGTNNAFQNKIDSQLSKQANKQSVLEKMHIKTLFTLLKTKNITLLDRMKNSAKIKELITRLILATDVAKHFNGVEKLKKLRENQEFDFGNTEHRYFILEQAFHACDIGNPCLEFKEYMNWAALLTDEFDNQTKLQAASGVQVTQMLRYKGIKQFYTGQIGFINFLCFPLWKQLATLWPGFNPLITNLEQNLKKLKQRSENETGE